MRDLVDFGGEMVKRTLRIDHLSPNSRLYFAELREIIRGLLPSPPGRSPQKLQIGKLRYLGLGLRQLWSILASCGRKPGQGRLHSCSGFLP